VTESPTGCTKQLISVAASVVPAALLMRPAGTKPFSCASRNLASQWARLSSDSMAASARATRRRTSATVCSSPLAYFSTRTSPEISCIGRLAAEGLTVFWVDALEVSLMVFFFILGGSWNGLKNSAEPANAQKI
jgi:hypothetical protein